MERQEIKRAFDEEYGNIIVTDSLKEKTLNRIKKIAHKKTVPVWLKSCAAVVLVGCLCVLASTNDIKTADVAENEAIMDINESAVTGGVVEDMDTSLKMGSTLRSNGMPKTYGTQNAKVETFNMATTEQTTKSMAPMMSVYKANEAKAEMLEDSVEEELALKVGDKEEIITKVYPDAVKMGDVYVAGNINIKVLDGIIVEIY